MLAAAVVASVLAGVTSVALFGRDAAPAESGNAACDTNDPLRVTADEAIAPTLTALGEQFADAVNAEDRPCVQIVVRAMSSRDVVTALVRGWDTAANGAPPDVWVPNSSVWLDVYRNESSTPELLPQDAVLLARSPLLFAMPQPMAEALPLSTVKWRELLELPDIEGGWGAFEHEEWGRPQLAVSDPLSSTTGMLALLSLGVAQDEIWAGGPTGNAAINIDSDLGVLRFRRAVAKVAPDVRTHLREYVDADDPLQVLSGMPLLERDLWLFNRGRLLLPEAGNSDASGRLVPMEGPPAIKLKAVYPTEGAFGADYPFVAMNGDWVDEMSAQIADEFDDFLLSDAAQDRFEADGFRDAENTSNPVHTMEDGLQYQLGGDLLELPEAAVLSSVQASWRNVTAPSKTLMVVDVSGSMVETVEGSEQTRLEATVAAAVQSLDVLPPASDAGLWEFSTDLPRGRNDGDYRELVPLGPLNEELDGVDRKTRIADGLTALEPQNDTALNDTTLAAYEAMQSSFEPGVRHTIVLMTDGRNDDEGSVSNDEVIAQLEQLQDEERPVRVVAVAYGEETDIAELERVAAATGGKVLTSPNAADLDELFLAALAGS